MVNRNTNIDDELIAKYLAGETNEEESLEIQRWLNGSSENQRYFDRLKNLWEKTGWVAPHQEADVDVDSGWSRFQEKLGDRRGKSEGGTKIRPLFAYLARVAAILVLAVLVYFIYHTFSKDIMVEQVLMASAEIKTDTLPDGSLISLNKNSILTYSGSFNTDQRSVQLKGEAFFNVIPDKKKPFVVKINNTTITVLGTSFYVEAYDSLGFIEVGVEEGRVSVASMGNEVVLSAGERVSVNKRSGGVTAVQAYDPNSIYWKSETLIFRDDSLEEVFATLEEIYQIRIEVSNAKILNCRLTGKFYQEPVDRMFEIIDANFGLTSERAGDRFIISGDGCE
ncbi:hypothetical protein C900_01099 [Fulvivirga imtechensis AK7]|uniref:Anti-sigma factor n=1 Tax=Fulvivirga imtechensis AK7 TaxID=1237149 RepID=L8JVB2_9BACT|nr:FecR domain-containing protein [Fulvivirga imtechensis]ELR72720.1 hypothetical protein C900_01099 [Fulvivirga imtechensis AK7]